MIRCILVAALALAGCVRVSVKRTASVETLRIDGSQGVMPLVAALASEYRALHPNVIIEMGAGLGTRARVDSLKLQRIDIALSSIGVVRDDMSRQGIVVHEIARVAVVFAVNASVPAANITQRQACDVYSGRITNWRQLGGPDLPVVPRLRPAGEVDGDVVLAGISCFRRAVAEGGARSLALPEDMANDLAGTIGAIGMTSVPFVQRSGGRLRSLTLDGVSPNAETVRSGAYPLARAVFLLVREGAPASVTRFIEFTRGADAAGIIAANGGVAIR